VPRRVTTNIVTGLVIAILGAGAGVVGWRMGRPAPAAAPHKAPAQTAAAAFLGAAKAMQGAASYQFSGRVTIGIDVLNVTWTFSTPDRLHETLQLVGGPPLERVSIGAVTYQRGPFGWAAVTASPAPGDPRAVFAALGTATGVAQQGSNYTFSVTGAGAAALVPGATAASVVTGTAAVASGWVQSLTYHSADGAGTTVSFTCTAIGSAPPVTAPAAPAAPPA